MKVLVVDDNAVNRLVASAALRRLGFVEVFEAAHGLAALSCAASRPLDLILLDVDMPVLDGPATLERLRSSAATAGIPVIFFTAGDTERVRRLGAEATLAKPMDPPLLAQAVVDVAVAAWRSRPLAPEHVRQYAGRERVLVADDNEYWRDLLECTLSAVFDVRTAGDGRAALDIAAEWLPAAVVLDVSMPLLAGHDVAQQVRRAAGARRPTILGFSAQEPTAAERGAFDEFVLKPARSHELVRRLLHTLRS